MPVKNSKKIWDLKDYLKFDDTYLWRRPTASTSNGSVGLESPKNIWDHTWLKNSLTDISATQEYTKVGTISIVDKPDNSNFVYTKTFIYKNMV